MAAGTRGLSPRNPILATKKLGPIMHTPATHRRHEYITP